MKNFNRWIAAGLFSVSLGVLAQVATYDVATNILRLPAVNVRTATFVNVTLVNIGDYNFTLQGATPQMPPDPADVSYDANSIFSLRSATQQPPPTSGNASVCFDPAYLATGTKLVLAFRYTNNGTFVRTTETQTDVQGPQTFNGQNTIAVNTRVSILTGDGAGTESGTLSFLQVQNLNVLTLGDVTNVGVRGGNSAVTTVLNPPIVFSYSLSPGQSITTVTEGTQTRFWFPFKEPATTFSETVTYTFLGVEDVAAPAGTFFGACKWATTRLRDNVATMTTQWMTRKGALVRTVTGSEIGELTSGTVNGRPVGPKSRPEDTGRRPLLA